MLSNHRALALPLIERGKRNLLRGRLDAALDCFRSAVEACPVADRSCLGNALYWLGLGLLRDSKRDIAARSFASAQKLLRHGHARKAYLRLTNEYGMPRQKKAEDDDRLAFFSIQIALYLKRRSRSGFGSKIERDSVLSTLASAWKGMSGCPGYKILSYSQRLTCFRTITVSYPLVLPLGNYYPDSALFDFGKKRVILPSESCPCGSGLPYGRCCGRTVGIAEASNGYF